MQFERLQSALRIRSLIKSSYMHLILEDADLDGRQIQCRHCYWHGNASELKKGDYFLLTNITELFCPTCSKYLGFIQHDFPVENEPDPLLDP